MLSKKYRFHSRGGVKYTYRAGRTVSVPGLSLVYAPNNRGYQRFAVVVSKKVLKLAVGRNRIRRRLYEAIRVNLSNFPKKTDYIFIIRSRDLKTIPFDDLQNRLQKLINEVKISPKTK